MSAPPGRLLDRIAARVADRATYERVLRPLIADLQFEHARARSGWQRAESLRRGVSAFWFALAATAIRSLALGTSSAEADVTRRRFRHAAWATSVFVLLLLFHDVRRMSEHHLGLAHAFLLPSVCCLALSLGALFGTALFEPVTGRAEERAVGRVGVFAGVLTFVIGAWLTPLANQEYRESTFRAVTQNVGSVTLEPGDRELTLGQLSVRIDQLRRSGRTAEAARFEVEWHKKPALGVASIVLVLLGAGIAATRWRRLWRICSIFAFVTAYWEALRVAEREADAGRLVPVLAMWAPVVVLGAYGALLAALARRQRPAAPS